MLLKSLWFRLESLWCRFIIGDVELAMVTNNMSELQYDFQKYWSVFITLLTELLNGSTLQDLQILYGILDSV